MEADLILLVTDIPDHHERYAAALRARGFAVEQARSGADALSLTLTSPPACIVIDVRLPDISGWELCRRLKRERAVAATPIVVLAHDASRATADASRDAGCHSWLARPTVGDDLVHAVQHVLSLGLSEPASRETAVLGVRECPACSSEEVRAGVRVGPVQYYGCAACGGRWRMDVKGAATA